MHHIESTWLARSLRKFPRTAVISFVRWSSTGTKQKVHRVSSVAYLTMSSGLARILFVFVVIAIRLICLSTLQPVGTAFPAALRNMVCIRRITLTVSILTPHNFHPAATAATLPL
jgi:hypothetical protein